MTHAIYRVTEFDIVAPYTLRIRFDDQSEQRIDFRPVLAGELYAHSEISNSSTRSSSTLKFIR